MWASADSKPSPMVSHGDMGATGLPPSIDVRPDGVDATSGKRDPVRPEVIHRPAEAAKAFPQPVPGVDRLVDAATEEDETVCDTGGPFERCFRGAAQPDRDGPGWLWQERCSINPVEASREVHDGIGEQPAEKLDLLLLSRTAPFEVLPEGLVLDVVPADPHTEPQPTAGQKVNVGCLPSHKRCLPLREHHDPGDEFDSLRDTGQIGEHDERVMERVKLRVRARQPPRPVGMHGAEHMVVRKQVAEAPSFRR